jgi:pyrimidine operon attenuation protein/uracil phosphoribosyltransferase
MKLPEAEKLCEQIAAELRPRIGPKSAMVGLYTGGAWLAERLHPLLGMKSPLGLMDIAFYRDDYAARGLKHDPKRTKIPFDVNGAELIEILLQDQLRRDRIDCLLLHAFQQRLRLDRRVALVDASHRQLEALLQPAREILRLPGHRVRRALHRRGQANHQAGGFPFFYEFFNLRKNRNGGKRMGGAQLGLADGDADALETKIEG